MASDAQANLEPRVWAFMAQVSWAAQARTPSLAFFFISSFKLSFFIYNFIIQYLIDFELVFIVIMSLIKKKYY
jgi:hypothetical protein